MKKTATIKKTDYTITKKEPIKTSLEVRLEKRIKELDERIEFLEKNNMDLFKKVHYLENKNIYDLSNKIAEDALSDATSAVNKLQPKYKVGDYVEYYYNSYEHTIKKGKTSNLFVLSGTTNNMVKFENGDVTTIYNIIGYAKPDLLTQEEKEYLKNTIKIYKFLIKSIKADDLYLNAIGKNEELVLKILYTKTSMFKNLEEDKEYTLEELGI